MSRRVGSPKAFVTAATAAVNSSALKERSGTPTPGSGATTGILPMSVVEILWPRRLPVPADDSEVRAALRGVEDPELEASIVDLGLVAGIARGGGTVVVHLALPLAEEHWPPDELVRRVEATVGALPGVETVVVERRPMTEAEVAATARVLRGEAPANPLAVLDA